MLKKLKIMLRLKVKRIRLTVIINMRIFLCRNVDSANYLSCVNCRRFQRCYRKYIERVKWII